MLMAVAPAEHAGSKHNVHAARQGYYEQDFALRAPRGVVTPEPACFTAHLANPRFIVGLIATDNRPREDLCDGNLPG